jgi:alkanesulfonate monooxygenase SsuD/methylene tetrahydromethanopterin reductase-like flavin-dependent oxidoreductase (luciferase family)
MLRLVGRAADGWLPSLPRLGRPGQLGEGNTIIDEAATAAGRSPHDIVRLLNLGGPGPAEQLADLALNYGTSVFTVMTSTPYEIEWFAAEIAPAVRDLVAAERSPAIVERVAHE